MAVEGDIAKLTVTGSCLGQVMQNVFFYRCEDAPTAGWAEGLATEFVGDVLLNIRLIQSAHFVWNGIQVVNLFDAADLYENPLNLVGTGSNTGVELMPAFAAYGFRLQRGNAQVRNGRKMIGGMAEEAQTGGGITAGFRINADIAADAMAVTLTAGLTDVFKPVIVGRVPYVTPAGDHAYRLPETQAEMGVKWAYVIAAQYRSITTMNSRKVGHGI